MLQEMLEEKLATNGVSTGLETHGGPGAIGVDFLNDPLVFEGGGQKGPLIFRTPKI